MSSFKIVGVVSESDVPEPTRKAGVDWKPVLDKLDAMTNGTVLHVQVTKSHHIKSIQNTLKKKRSMHEFDVYSRGSTKEVINVYIKRIK